MAGRASAPALMAPDGPTPRLLTPAGGGGCSVGSSMSAGRVAMSAGCAGMTARCLVAGPLCRFLPPKGAAVRFDSGL